MKFVTLSDKTMSNIKVTKSFVSDDPMKRWRAIWHYTIASFLSYY